MAYFAVGCSVEIVAAVLFDFLAATGQIVVFLDEVVPKRRDYFVFVDYFHGIFHYCWVSQDEVEELFE